MVDEGSGCGPQLPIVAEDVVGSFVESLPRVVADRFRFAVESGDTAVAKKVDVQGPGRSGAVAKTTWNGAQ